MFSFNLWHFVYRSVEQKVKPAKELKDGKGCDGRMVMGGIKRFSSTMGLVYT